MGEWLESWLAGKLDAGALRPTTARCYRSHLDDYLIPWLGRIRLCELRAVQISAMYAGIRAQHRAAVEAAEREQEAAVAQVATTGRGPRRVSRPPSFTARPVIRLHATLHAALNAAVRAGEVDRNVARSAEVPRGRPANVRPWQPQVSGAFLDFVADDRLAALFHLAGHAGLRRGEVCGLRWSDVDLDARVLAVRRQVVEVGGRLVTGSPKTRSGEDRRVDLDIGTVQVLRAWRRRQAAEQAQAGTACREDGLVFTYPDGTGLRPGQVSHRFRRLVAQAGLPACRFHDLRHLAASLQLAAGVDVAIVSKRLGHSTQTITADTYCHLIGTVGRQAAEAAAALVPRGRRSLAIA